MSSSSTPAQLSWHQVKFDLQDGRGTPLPTTVFPYPTGSRRLVAGATLSPPASVRQLCTLPPADVAQSMSPNAIEPHNGCSSGWSHGASLSRISVQRGCVRSDGMGGQAMDPQCVWEALTQVPNSIDLKDADGRFCLPLDDPALLATNNGQPIVPVPVPIPKEDNVTSEFSFRQYPYRTVPVLKQYLESHNHSAANSPIFANTTVRPAHKRLRLGVCVAFPPVGSPCDMSAINNTTGTIADGWLFPGGSRASHSEHFDVALARPLSALSPMLGVGPNLNSLDQVTTSRSSSSLPPPYPFLTYRTAEVGSTYVKWNPAKAWAIPLVACVPSSSTNNSTLGTIRPLTIDGTCASNRECLSGACHAANKTCDNSIKQATDSPFVPSLAIPAFFPRPLVFPSNLTTRQILDKYSGHYAESELPETWTYYWPLIASGIALFLVLVATYIWTGDGQRIARKWTRKWRTTTERDEELKPVSGRMVADLGDEAAVQEAVAAAREELPVYVEVRDGNDEYIDRAFIYSLRKCQFDRVQTRRTCIL